MCLADRSLPVIGIKNAYFVRYLFLTYGALHAHFYQISSCPCEWGCGACCLPTHNNRRYQRSNMAAVEASQTQSIINLKDVLDASTANIPTLTAVGYAVTSSQPGRSESQKRLMAIRSARMAAMRDLAEQIHGLQVDSNTTVIDLVVQNDTFRGVVAGTIRGARTVRINPTGADTYEVVLEIDRETIGYLLQTARQTV